MSTDPKHYPPTLVDVLEYVEVPTTVDSAGGKILVFLDEMGARVTLRLQDKVSDTLLRKLQAGASRPQAQSH